MPLYKREIFSHSLKLWFEVKKRSLPWRLNPSPYRVWVSEVMLQQTRAATVISYFEKWMARFPSIETLAAAKEWEVLKLWEGLGYYSRARNLYQAAQMLVENHKGQLPRDSKELRKVKGIGSYTASAIMSFAYHKKAAAVDGNVQRVMSRFLCIEEEVDQSKVQKKIEKEVKNFLPEKEPWIVMEALIELGAQVCKKKAECLLCPIRKGCLAYEKGKVSEIPKKRKKQSTIILHRKVFVIECDGAILIHQRKNDQIMAGLCEFPFIEKGEPFFVFEKIKPLRKLNCIVHTFTRYKAYLYPEVFRSKTRFSCKEYNWVDLKRLNQLAFSSGHRKILEKFLEDHANFTH